MQHTPQCLELIFVESPAAILIIKVEDLLASQQLLRRERCRRGGTDSFLMAEMTITWFTSSLCPDRCTRQYFVPWIVLRSCFSCEDGLLRCMLLYAAGDWYGGG